MRISIITISYNQRAYLQDCLDSISAQLGPEDEHIIVDPGSIDGSRDLLSARSKCDNRLMAVFKKDSGPADGLNNGFSVATGDILGYINADDFVFPGGLEYVRNFFSKHPEVDVLIGAIKLTDNLGRPKLRGRVSDHPSCVRVTADCFQYYQQGTFFRRDAFTAVKGFNISNKTCWDRELIIDMLIEKQKVHVVSKPLAAFRLHSASITGSGANADKYLADTLRIRQKILDAGYAPPSFIIKTMLKAEARLNPLRIIRQCLPI